MTPSQPNPPEQPLRASKARRKDEAILALLQSPTLEKAAQTVGVHPSTLRRWWKDPEFRRRYDEARDTVFLLAKGRMQQGCQAAVGTVFQIMRDLQAPAGTRLQAAKYVLDQDRRSSRAQADPDDRQMERLVQRLQAARKRVDPSAHNIKVTFVKPSEAHTGPKTSSQFPSEAPPEK